MSDNIILELVKNCHETNKQLLSSFNEINQKIQDILVLMSSQYSIHEEKIKNSTKEIEELKINTDNLTNRVNLIEDFNSKLDTQKKTIWQIGGIVWAVLGFGLTILSIFKDSILNLFKG